MKSFLTAGFALATCAAFAALEKQVFDGLANGAITAEGNWKGGVVEPITTGSNDKVLAIDGTVSCNNGAATESEFVKTSFKVFAPADATATTDLPTGSELEGCQIAIATGPEVEVTGTSMLEVMVYQGTTTGWVSSGLTVAENDWFEVTLHFDYTAKKAKVQIGDNVSKTLFNLVTAPNDTIAKINSLSFVGSSKIDNVSIAEAIAKGSLADTLDGLEIYAADLPNGVEADNLKSDNNFTKHIEAGLTPSDSVVTFNATALSTESTQPVITVPCDKDYGQVYQVVINDTTTVPATAGDIKGGARALKFTVPSTLTSTKVLKFQVKVGAPTASSNSNT